MRRLSVRGQLALWFAACLAAGLVAFGGGVYLLFSRYLLAGVDRSLEEEILEVSREVRQADAGELRTELDENFGRHPFYRISVSGPRGESVFATSADAASVRVRPPAREGVYLRETVSAEGAGGPSQRLIAERVERPEGPYAVVVADSLDAYRRTLGRLFATLAVLGPAAIGLSLLGGYWLSRRALAPVDRLTQAALSITATDLNRRVPDDGPRDEVGRLAEAFNVMIARLEAAFDETRRFTADAAHELRTPLAVLRTGAEVALRSAATADDYRAALADQLDEIDRLARLADQLLFLCREDACREDAGQAAEPPEPVRLDLLLEEVCESLQLSAEARSLTLACDELSPCVVAARPDRLRRLFLNLLDNALRYTPPAGRIDVRLGFAAGRAVATIADTGPGIAPEHLPHVFERFYRGDASRSRATGGSGLGLAICRSIADSLAGEVRLENRPGGGLTATVRLPAEAPLVASSAASELSAIGAGR